MVNVLLFAMPDRVPMFDMATRVPSLGLASIAGNVPSDIADIKIADLVLSSSQRDEDILQMIRSHGPDLVGLSCMSFQYPTALRLARLIKTYDSHILITLGGYHPSLMYKEIGRSADAELVDFIVRGEAEATFRELAGAVNRGTGYERIAGLSYKHHDEFRHNPSRALQPLDEIQLPLRTGRLLTKGAHAFGRPADAIETSRGCTYSCKFCSIQHMYGRSFRKYPISRVVADIRNAQQQGARTLILTDDNITLDLSRLEELCDIIIAEKLSSLQYILQASVRGIAHSRKLVSKMADAGVRLVFLGIESTSQPNLNFLGKSSSTSEETKKAVGHLRDCGILCFGGFIVGNPDDDEASLWEAWKVAWDLQIDLPVFLILTPHVKTIIREELLEAGLLTNPDDLSTYHGFAANVHTHHLGAEELDRIVAEMYKAYYSRLRYLKLTRVWRLYPGYFLWRILQHIMHN